MITFIRIIHLKARKIKLMKNNNDMSIEISNDFYDKDYDDISVQEIETSEDDSDAEAAEQFGY